MGRLLPTWPDATPGGSPHRSAVRRVAGRGLAGSDAADFDVRHV